MSKSSKKKTPAEPRAPLEVEVEAPITQVPKVLKPEEPKLYSNKERRQGKPWKERTK